MAVVVLLSCPQVAMNFDLSIATKLHAGHAAGGLLLGGVVWWCYFPFGPFGQWAPRPGARRFVIRRCVSDERESQKPKWGLVEWGLRVPLLDHCFKPLMLDSVRWLCEPIDD